MTNFYLTCLISLLAVAVGCGPADQNSKRPATLEARLPVISGSRLSEYVRGSSSPVLVEFGVDFNCPRCVQTKSDIVRLRETLQGDVDVVRVDFNANAQMGARLGGTVCPTYVLFDRDEPVLTRSFPVSIDLLEGEILRLIEE